MDNLYTLLPHIYIFQRVAQCGSFQAAANELLLPRSSVSKKVAQLEAALGQRLIQRSTRQLRLTDDGARLLASSDGLPQVVTDAREAKLAASNEPAGVVRISSSTLLGQRYVLPLIKPLRRRYPKVRIELNLSDEVVDLIASAVDLAIRVGHLADSSMVAKKVGEKSWQCFASPEYLTSHPALTHPNELSSHDCLIFKNSAYRMDTWSLMHATGETANIAITPCFVADDGRTLVDMACQGMGIIYVDALLIEPELSSGKLIPVLPDWQDPSRSPINLLSLGHHTRSKAVDAVWKFLGRELQKKLMASHNREA